MFHIMTNCTRTLVTLTSNISSRHIDSIAPITYYECWRWSMTWWLNNSKPSYLTCCAHFRRHLIMFVILSRYHSHLPLYVSVSVSVSSPLSFSPSLLYPSRCAHWDDPCPGSPVCGRMRCWLHVRTYEPPSHEDSCTRKKSSRSTYSIQFVGTDDKCC